MDANSQQIALVVEHPHDAQLAQHLLRGIKHQLTIYDANNQHHRERIAHLQSDVVIVFHRTIEGSPNAGLGACLPKTCPRRLIVLSDCHREDSIIDALDAGAHHYFDINETSYVLKVRIESALRSHQHHALNILEVAPFKFNVERRKVTNNGKSVHLSPREFSLAYFLFSNHDRIVFDSELMVSIWTLPSSMDSRRIDTAICRIRKKMNLYEDNTDWSLQRLRQVGYQLVNHAPFKNQSASQNTSMRQEATRRQTSQQHATPSEQRVVSLPQPTPAKPNYAIAG